LTKAVAIVLVLAVVGAILAGTGVSAGELVVFGGFEIGFVLLPGVVAYRALAGRPGGLLQQVSIGAALGHGLLLGAFMLTAAADARWALWLYPPVVLALAAILAGGRVLGRAGDAASLTNRQVIVLAGVAVAAVLLMALTFFTQVPLPGSRPSVSYYPDLMWGLGFAAEALHHWPLTTPQVLGEPLRYHTFVFSEMAAASQLTGIELPVVGLRLVPASLLLLLVGQLAYAGRRFTGNPWAGPVAAGLILLVGDLDLGAGRPEPLAGVYFSGLFLSPTQLLGLVFFLPTIAVVADLLEAERERPRKGVLVMLAILLFGCAGAKASILPVLVGGLVVYGLWRRRAAAGWVAAFAFCGVAFVASYVLLYSGGRGATDVGLLESALSSFPGQELAPRAGEGAVGVLIYPFATWVTAVALMVPLAGLAFLHLRVRSLTPLQAWPLALLAVSVAAFFVLDLPGVSQLYFLWYGFTAAALLASGGLLEGLGRWRAHPRRGGAAALLAGVAGGVVLGWAPIAEGLPLVTVYMAVAAVLGGVVVAFALGLVGTRGASAWPAVLAVSTLLTAGALDGPRDRLPDIASRALRATEAVHREADPATERGLTSGLARGLAWVRDNTDESAVLAVNNHLRSPPTRQSLYFYYSALGERRVFVESWDYTDEAVAIGVDNVRAGRQPFPERVALNDSVFTGAGPRAAERLRRRGVTHLVVDLVNGQAPPGKLPGTLVYHSDALLVYRL